MPTAQSSTGSRQEFCRVGADELEIHANAFSPLDDSLLFTSPFHVC